MWWHIKSGEIIAQKGIIYKDLLSQAGPQRAWYPYEWSFQLGIYQYTHLFGIRNIRYFVGILGVLQVLSLFLLLIKVAKLKWYWTLCICLSLVFLNYSSFTPRPDIISQTFFILNLFSTD